MTKYKIIPWGFKSLVVVDTGELPKAGDVLFICYPNEAKKIVELLNGSPEIPA